MTVSVIIPTFNAASTLSRAIESVLQQTIPANEIIIVDDASTDDSRDIVVDLARRHPKIQLLALENNSGQSHARNRALAFSRSQWIATLDADDCWKPKRLERLLQLATAHNADFAADNIILYDAVAQKEVRPGFVGGPEHFFLDVSIMMLSDRVEISEFQYSLLKPLLRRDFLQRTGIRYDESIRYGEDFKFYCELLFNGAKAVVTKEAYYVYSTRIGEVSGKRSPHSTSIARFDTLVKIGDDLKVRYWRSLSEEIERAIESRRRQLLMIHHANVAREFRLARQYVDYVLYLFARPRVICLLATRIMRRAMSRVSG